MWCLLLYEQREPGNGSDTDALTLFGLFPVRIQRRIKLQDVDEILVSLNGELQRTIAMLRDEWIELLKRVKEIDRLPV